MYWFWGFAEFVRIADAEAVFRPRVHLMLVRLEEEMAQFIPSTETATLEAFAENPVPLI